jgi:indole-3-glycerol phosphate synthase/indole-3-glycerol phosphate synthase/phosphoribosylanthranilate isomerase
MIGINNRDLSTFQTDLSVAMELTAYIEGNTGIIPVALSGISNPEDIAVNLSVGIRRFLVGESLVKAKDPALLLQQMCSVPFPEKR